ncbi:MAG: TetR/AcrR family transcriptional regulator [Firmicutes bacterium]|nr:TetR/AcrR family transcriptional regulator [Bacillota bacterium]
MARYTEVNERLREATRDKIVYAAIALFAEKGFAGTSIRDISEGAGVAVGLVYQHYKSKEEIHDAIVAEANAELKEFRKFSIEELANGAIEEMSKSIVFAQWVTIMPCLRDFILALEPQVGRQKAQYFMAKLKGLCAIQLALKDEFIVPTPEMLMAGVVKKKEDKK